MLEIAKREWLKSLVGYSFERIDQAFEKCKTEFMTPPSLGQFLTCFSHERCHKLFTPALPLLESEEDREKRRERGFEAIKKIKDMLKNTPNPKPNKREREKFISQEDEARALAELEAEKTET